MRCGLLLVTTDLTLFIPVRDCDYWQGSSAVFKMIFHNCVSDLSLNIEANSVESLCRINFFMLPGIIT